MNRWLRWVGIGIPVAALAGGSAFAQEMKTPATVPAKQEQKKDDAKKDIVAVAVEQKFTVLADLLKAADLVDTLKGTGPFTIFAPTDEAFNKLKAELDDLKKPENKAKLTKILKYHVLNGKVMAADVLKMDGKSAKTLEGEEIKIAVKDDKVTLNGDTNVTKTEFAASNGVIHVIDTVLTPPAEKPKTDKPAEMKPAEPKADKPAEKKPAEPKK